MSYRLGNQVLGAAPSAAPAAVEPPRWPIYVALGGVVVIGFAGLGTTIYLLAKAKWAWAAANFFVFTPVALIGGTVGASLAMRNYESKKADAAYVRQQRNLFDLSK